MRSHLNARQTRVPTGRHPMARLRTVLLAEEAPTPEEACRGDISTNPVCGVVDGWPRVQCARPLRHRRCSVMVARRRRHADSGDGPSCACHRSIGCPCACQHRSAERTGSLRQERLNSTHVGKRYGQAGRGTRAICRVTGATAAHSSWDPGPLGTRPPGRTSEVWIPRRFDRIPVQRYSSLDSRRFAEWVN